MKSLPLLALLAVFLAISVIAIMEPDADGRPILPSPQCDVPGSGDWTITTGCTCTNNPETNVEGSIIINVGGTLDMTNCNFNVHGDVIVNTGGTLTMHSSTIDFDDAFTYCQRNVRIYGTFTFHDSSLITDSNPSWWPWKFVAYPNSAIDIDGSTFDKAGYANTCPATFQTTGASVTDSTFSQCSILKIMSNNSDFERNFVTGSTSSNPAVLFDTAFNNVFSYNGISYSQNNGLSVQFSGYNMISWNNVNTSGGVGIDIQSDNNTVAYNTVRDNEDEGIYVQNALNVSMKYNDIINNSMGIRVIGSNVSILNNYIFRNRGDGIHNEAPVDGFDIRFNRILNNTNSTPDVTGWAVWSSQLGAANMGIIDDNVMCYNSNTTFWTRNTNGIAYDGRSPQNNRFCVNVSRPIHCGCTESDQFNFYVDGNPLSWVPAGLGGNPSNCSVSIDGAEKAFVYTPGAYHMTGVNINGTSLAQGSHSYSVHCDPYGNTADETGTWDINGPGYDYWGSGGGSTPGPGCVPNITLAVRWLDGTCNVTHVILSTNETGAHKNYTDGSYGSPKGPLEWNYRWTNFSWWNASVNGMMVNWFAWANDTAGRWNHTTNATFLADPCTVESIVTGLGGGMSFGKCGNVTLAVFWNSTTTNVSWAWLRTNETGAWRNYSSNYGSPKLINASSGWSNFSWWNQSMRGQRVFWQGCANTTYGGENCSGITQFTAVPCANATPSISGVCNALTLRVIWEETAVNQSMIFLSTNETGSWQNKTSYGSPANITEGASETDFSWWNASVTGLVIGWKAYWNSSLDDWMESANSTFTAQPCATPPPILGGGGGGGMLGGGPSACTVDRGNMTLAPAAAGKVVTCSLQTDFRLFNFTFRTASGPAKVVIEETARPSGVSDPAASTYKFYRLSVVNLTDDIISSVSADFLVPNSWLRERGLDPSGIALYRWGQTTVWERQPPGLSSVSGDSTRFNARIISIRSGTFAVAGGKACTACPVPTEWSVCLNGTHSRTSYTCSGQTGFECVSGIESGACIQLPLVDEFQRQPESVQFTQILVIASALLLFIFFYMRRKRKHPEEKGKFSLKASFKKLFSFGKNMPAKRAPVPAKVPLKKNPKPAPSAPQPRKNAVVAKVPLPEKKVLARKVKTVKMVARAENGKVVVKRAPAGKAENVEGKKNIIKKSLDKEGTEALKKKKQVKVKPNVQKRVPRSTDLSPGLE